MTTITALKEATPAAIAPKIDGIEVRLGDIVKWGHGTDMASKFSQATRVRGWSPEGDRLTLGWVGEVKVEDCRWYQEIGTGDLRFALLYRAATRNLWGDPTA